MTNCNISSPEWYRCPIPITIFTIFLFLFIYSIVVLVKCTQIITDKHFDSDEFNTTLYDVFVIYIVNLVVTFISLIVILFFLYKILPESVSESLFNDYAGMIFVLYIFIISCWTLSVFGHIKNVFQGDVQVVAGIALSLSCVAIILYTIKIVLAYRYNTSLDIGQISKAYKQSNKPKQVQMTSLKNE